MLPDFLWLQGVVLRANTPLLLQHCPNSDKGPGSLLPGKQLRDKAAEIFRYQSLKAPPFRRHTFRRKSGCTLGRREGNGFIFSVLSRTSQLQKAGSQQLIGLASSPIFQSILLCSTSHQLFLSLLHSHNFSCAPRGRREILVLKLLAVNLSLLFWAVTWCHTFLQPSCS